MGFGVAKTPTRSRADQEALIRNLANKVRIFASSSDCELGIINPLGINNPHKDKWHYYWFDTSAPLAKNRIESRRRFWGVEIVPGTKENAKLLGIPESDIVGKVFRRGDLVLGRYPRAAWEAKTAFNELTTLDRIRKVDLEGWRALGRQAVEVSEHEDVSRGVDLAEMENRPREMSTNVRLRDATLARTARAVERFEALQQQTALDSGAIGQREELSIDDGQDEDE